MVPVVGVLTVTLKVALGMVPPVVEAVMVAVPEATPVTVTGTLV